VGYSIVLGQASFLYGLQDLAAPAVDSLGGPSLAATAAPVFAVPGPRPWLPRAVSFPVVNDRVFAAAVPVITGAVGFTFAGWVRSLDAAAGLRVLFAGTDFPFLRLLNSQLGFSPPWGTFESTLALTVNTWHYVSISRSDDGLVLSMSRDGVVQSFASVATPLVASGFGFSAALFSALAQVSQGAFFRRAISQANINVLAAGPGFEARTARFRGSGRFRAPGG
jgi:hypothetical protein